MNFQGSRVEKVMLVMETKTLIFYRSRMLVDVQVLSQPKLQESISILNLIKPDMVLFF